MPLPKIDYETHDIKIPVLDKTVKLRPMTGYDEKVLLKAKEDDNRAAHLEAVRQVVDNCATEKDVDVLRLPMFALEYLFVKLRGISVSNVLEQTYRDNEDNELYTFNIDVDELQIRDESDEEAHLINVNEDVLIELRWPPVELYVDDKFYEVDDAESMIYVMRHATKAIYQGDQSYDLKKETIEEIERFVDSLPVGVLEKIKDFFLNAPSLYYEIQYTNKKGTERNIVLSTLDDFFTFV